MREHQFIVERVCESVESITVGYDASAFPFVVWVHWPAEGVLADCGKPYYRMTDESFDAARKHFGITLPSRPFVCGGMGHLIE